VVVGALAVSAEPIEFELWMKDEGFSTDTSVTSAKDAFGAFELGVQNSYE
jgi:hypothetical protein